MYEMIFNYVNIVTLSQMLQLLIPRQLFLQPMLVTVVIVNVPFPLSSAFPIVYSLTIPTPNRANSDIDDVIMYRFHECYFS